MRNSLLLGAAFALLSTTASVAMPVVFSTSDGGDGFAYEVVFANTNYFDSRTAARARTFRGVSGNLAALSSEAQVRFILGLSDGPYSAFANGLGTSSTNLVTSTVQFGTRFTDVNGLFPSFTKNFFTGSGTEGLVVRRTNATGAVTNGDVTIGSAGINQQFAFIVQFEITSTTPIPVPASLPLAATGLGALALIARRRVKAKALKAA